MDLDQLKHELHANSLKDKMQFLTYLNDLVDRNITKCSMNIAPIDKDFLEEVKTLSQQNEVKIFIGKSLKDIKCVIVDDSDFREHEVIIFYKGPKKYSILSVTLPYSSLQDQEYVAITDIVNAVKKHAQNLAAYMYELDKIDRLCTVMDPIKPSLREDYRQILLDDRTWLHIEITFEGFPRNIHLIGQSEIWHTKLQEGLLKWDYDRDIVDNILSMFDLTDFPVASSECISVKPDNLETGIPCNICLCVELPDNPGRSQPLCQNTNCGVYFHRSCLFEWLIACGGGRPPTYGVMTGSCPTCLEPIVCNEKDG